MDSTYLLKEILEKLEEIVSIMSCINDSLYNLRQSVASIDKKI